MSGYFEWPVVTVGLYKQIMSLDAVKQDDLQDIEKPKSWPVDIRLKFSGHSRSRMINQTLCFDIFFVDCLWITIKIYFDWWIFGYSSDRNYCRLKILHRLFLEYIFHPHSFYLE